MDSGNRLRSFFAWLILTLSLLGKSHALGQQQDLTRRAILKSPGISIVSKLPTGAVLAMKINNGRLFVAGADRVVRAYPLNENGDIDIESVVIYRWPSANEYIGQINAIAINSNGTRLAVGGIGLTRGLVCEIDLKTGKVLRSDRSLPNEVWQIEYGSDGTIWYGTVRGGLVRWDAAGEGKIVLTESATEIPICGIFPKPNGCLAVRADGLAHFIENQTLKQVRQIPMTQGEKISIILRLDGSDGYFFISDNLSRKSNAIREWHSVSERSKKLLEATGQELIFSQIFLTATNKKLVVGLRRKRNATAELVLRDIDSNEQYSFGEVPYFERPRALAVQGNSIFIGSTDTFLKRFKPDLNQEKIASFKQQLIVSRELGDLRWIDNQGFSWTRGDQHYAFDPKQRELSVPKTEVASPRSDKKLSSVTAIESTIEGGYQCAITFKSGTKLPLDLDGFEYNFVTSTKTLRYDDKDLILAGHYYGITVFQVGADESLKIVRRLLGHSGFVTDIDVDVDRGLVLSSSDDGTICCFSLAPWKFHPELGASFSIVNGKLRVNSIDPGSPIWDTGLDEGEEIDNVWYMGQPLDPEKALEALRQPRLGQQFQFKTARLETSSRCFQRPIWKFYHDDLEWVWWRFKDFYYDCSQNGEQLIQWQINQGFQTPLTINGTEARSRFYRPLKMQDLLSQARAAPERINVPELIPPTVTMSLEDRNDHYLAKTALEVDQNALLVNDPREMSVWVNDHRVANWPRPDIGTVQECRIDKRLLRSGKNRVIARAFNDIGIRGDSRSYAIDLPPQRAKPVMRSLAIGVNDYSKTRYLNQGGEQQSFRTLNYSVRDAKSIARLLSDQVQGYENVDARLLTDEEATSDNIVRQIEEIGKVSRPDDIFVVSFSGHGYGFPETSDSSEAKTFLLVTSNADLRSKESLFKTTLPIGAIDQGDEQPSVFNALAKLSCRKIVLIDACYSGGALEVVKSLTPDLVVGPTIFTASQATQQAHEVATKARGIFTETIREAISENFKSADRSGDQKISVKELFDYTSIRVPEIFDSAKLFIPPDEFRKGQKPDFWSPKEDQNLPIFVRATQ
jgi:WD40 repeat protein